MDRNANDTFGNQNKGKNDAGFSRDTGADGGGVGERARNVANAATERLGNVGSNVRDRAGSLKDTLADALETGAEKLRTQGAGGGQIAGAAVTGGSASMVTDDNRREQATNQVAGGLQASADWLRDFDIDGVKSGIERQVKEHPARTLAIAVGLGYLLGKAIRK
jgi:ElaB/YqjD/DUF883 family membrane-anchored ribosome-binding protein